MKPPEEDELTTQERALAEKIRLKRLTELERRGTRATGRNGGAVESEIAGPQQGEAEEPVPREKADARLSSAALPIGPPVEGENNEVSGL